MSTSEEEEIKLAREQYDEFYRARDRAIRKAVKHLDRVVDNALGAFNLSGHVASPDVEFDGELLEEWESVLQQAYHILNAVTKD